MVVSLGGVLHAVNPVTKKTLWSFASGPEVSTTFMAGRDKETKEINSSLDVVADDGLNGETEDWSMFSGPDGKLYVHDKNGIAVSFCIVILLCNLLLQYSLQISLQHVFLYFP